MWASCLSRVFYPSILCLNAFIISTNIAQVTRSENWVLPGACWLNVVTSQFTNSPRGSFPLFLTFAQFPLTSYTRVLSENLLENEIMNVTFGGQIAKSEQKNMQNASYYFNQISPTQWTVGLQPPSSPDSLPFCQASWFSHLLKGDRLGKGLLIGR